MLDTVTIHGPLDTSPRPPSTSTAATRTASAPAAHPHAFPFDLKVGGGRHVELERPWPRVLAEVDRLTAAGAAVMRQVDIDGHGDHVVMSDPEGDEFCVV